MPMRTEIDCLPAMAAHPAPVGVPVITGIGQALRFRAWAPGASMIPGDFGAMIPEGAIVCDESVTTGRNFFAFTKGAASAGDKGKAK